MVGPQIKMFCEGGNLRIEDSVSNQLKAEYNIDLTNFKRIVAEDLEAEVGTGILDRIYNKYNIKKRKPLFG